MISDVGRWSPAYADAELASVTLHIEASNAPIKLERELRARGPRRAALRPATTTEPYLDLLTEIDMLLIMTVEPGFGGQAYIGAMLPKIACARKAVDGSSAQVAIQVDGASLKKR